MPNIRAFQALHYSPDKVDLAMVIAPPYDVISAAHLDRLYVRSPQNVVRLILNREADRYGAAATELTDWKARGLLRNDATAALYYYVQDFRLKDGSSWQRTGLLAAVELAQFSEKKILPHERTFAKAKEDRLKLVRACKTNLSPIFGMYANRTEALAPARALADRESPWIDVTDDANERHRVWRIDAPADIEHIASGLRDATVFIADGHHRYETSLNYQAELRSNGINDPTAPHNFILMYLASMDDKGLVILPTHRVFHRFSLAPADLLAKLGESFSIERIPGDAAGQKLLSEKIGGKGPRGRIGIALAGESNLFFLQLKDQAALDRALAQIDPSVRSLDVSILDAFVLRGILAIDVTAAGQDGQLSYTHDDAEAIEAVREKGAQVSFLIRAPGVYEVEAVCMSGQVMPEKSTYFYPKLLSGLVFHGLE